MEEKMVDFTMEEARYQITDLFLTNTKPYLNQMILEAMQSVPATKKVIKEFTIGLYLLLPGGIELFESHFNNLLDDLSWLKFKNKNFHKAWLILMTLKAQILYTQFLTVEEIIGKYGKQENAIKEKEKELSSSKELLATAKAQSKRYYEILKQINTKVPNEIKNPSKIQHSTPINTLHWALDQSLLNILFNGLKSLQFIHLETQQEIFTQAFTNLPKDEFKTPILWCGTTRLLSYLMEQLQLKKWIANGNKWPSVIEKAGIFIREDGKEITSNDLLSAKSQYSAFGNPEGSNQIDTLLSEISKKLKVT